MFIELHYKNKGKSNEKPFWIDKNAIDRINKWQNDTTFIIMLNGNTYAVQESIEEINKIIG